MTTNEQAAAVALRRALLEFRFEVDITETAEVGKILAPFVRARIEGVLAGLVSVVDGELVVAWVQPIYRQGLEGIVANVTKKLRSNGRTK